MMLVMARLGSAQGVNAPVAGIVLDDANRLVPVHGVFGNLLRGKPITLPAGSKGALVSASFSDNSGLLKSASAFVITDGSGQEQSSEQATDGGSAMASFASNGSLQWFCAGACITLQTPQGATVSTAIAGGTVVALGATTAQSISLLTSSGTQLWSSSLSTAAQSISDQLAVSGATPAMGFNGGWLTTSATGLIWTAPNGATTPIRIPSPVQTLQASGSRTVSINARWMINGALQLLEIPVRPQVPPKPRTLPVLVTR
jgi:hypothetical protein